MDGEKIPEERIEKVNATLSDALGLHGSWVLAIETYNEEGEPQLSLAWSPDGTGWQKLGMARALILDLEVPFRESGD
jgi:hypothetical protein